MDPEFIPFHRPSIGEEEVRAVAEVLRLGWLTMGPKTREFEQAFAEYIGCRYAIAVSSCTAALHLALDAIGLKPGEEVIVPTNTFTATAAVVAHSGGRIVFADTLENGFNIDSNSTELKISPRTRAVIAVHVAGEPCNMDALERLGKRHQLTIIEDAAHALPAAWLGHMIGTISPLTAFSFYATKTLTTGEGGMLTTDCESMAERAQVMRLHGISRDAWNRYSGEGTWHYEVMDAGFKYNMTDFQAALGLCQLRRANEFLRKREQIAQSYRDLLSDVEEIELPSVGPEIRHAWHLFIIRLRLEKLNITRNLFIEELWKSGIGTSVHFIPLHLHPYYSTVLGYRRGDFPNAERTFDRCISLPIFPSMQPGEVERVASTVRRICKEYCIAQVYYAADV